MKAKHSTSTFLISLLSFFLGPIIFMLIWVPISQIPSVSSGWNGNNTPASYFGGVIFFYLFGFPALAGAGGLYYLCFVYWLEKATKAFQHPLLGRVVNFVTGGLVSVASVKVYGAFWGQHSKGMGQGQDQLIFLAVLLVTGGICGIMARELIRESGSGPNQSLHRTRLTSRDRV